MWKKIFNVDYPDYGINSLSKAYLTVEDGAVILRKVDRAVRKGWDEAAQTLAAQGDDDLLMGEFANDADAQLVWSSAASITTLSAVLRTLQEMFAE